MWPVPKGDADRREFALWAILFGYLIKMRAARYGAGILAWLIWPEYWPVILTVSVYVWVIWEIDNSADSNFATILRHLRSKH